MIPRIRLNKMSRLNFLGRLFDLSWKLAVINKAGFYNGFILV